MSSGTRTQSRGGHNTAMGLANQLGSFGPTYEDSVDRIGRLGLSPRQQELNRLWCYYTCTQYAARQIDWDGHRHVEGIDHEAIASATYIPPGFYDAQGAMLPLKFRRPTAPYHICKVIVDRFTGLLFSEKRHPKLAVEGDPLTEDFINTLIDEGRLWAAMLQARTFGGACGSVSIGFQFVDGVPVFEVHDPRWTFPYFADRLTHKLSAIEKRYIYPVEIRDAETGEWHEVPMWYRRVIDDQFDIIFKPEPVGDGAEPMWVPDVVTEHRFGFCPAVWIQNLPVVGDIDGDTDCQGVYDMAETYDALTASAVRATIYNCDPTLVISTDAPMADVKKGHNQAIKVEKGGSVSLVESALNGAEGALSLADSMRKRILEVAQCHLEGEGDVPQTATEVERRYSSMIAKADILREQYGEKGIKPLVNMVILAAKILSAPKIVDGNPVRHVIKLPPKVETDSKTGQVQLVERKLGNGPHRVSMNWPKYFEPSLQDTQLAVTAASGAKAAGLVDLEHAVKAVAEHYGVEDIGALVKKLQDDESAQQALLDAMSMGEPGQFE